MKKLNTALASLVVMTALGTPALAFQDPKPEQTTPVPAQPAPAVPSVDDQQRPQLDMRTEADQTKNMATGRLVRVSTDDMTIVIKGADDQEHEFRYTDNTKVIGAQEQVSGLSTKAGSLVTVHFTEGAGDARIATKVHFDTKTQQ
jgi:hypothetical protein